MTDVKTFYVLQPPPVCSPSVSDSRILFQGGTERRQLLGQPLHHWVLQLGLMRAVETVKGIWIVQRIHLHTQIQGNVVFFLQLTVLTWVFLASWTNLSDILFPNVHKKIFFSFTPKCVFVSPSQWWCVQERERAARKSTAVFLHAKLLQKQLPWEALNWTAFPRQRGRKDPRLLTSACVLMRFSCYTNRLFDLSYRFHVFSLSFFSLYHFIPLHFNVFSTRSSPHHPTPSLLSFTVPLFHLLPLSFHFYPLPPLFSPLLHHYHSLLPTHLSTVTWPHSCAAEGPLPQNGHHWLQPTVWMWIAQLGKSVGGTMRQHFCLKQKTTDSELIIVDKREAKHCGPRSIFRLWEQRTDRKREMQ